MNELLSHEQYERAANVIRGRLGGHPRVAVVLGSGLNPVAEQVGDAVSIPYQEVPGFPRATVEGHAGRLIHGTLEGRSVVFMQGRAHYYEGVSMQQVTFPVRVMRLLGIETLIVTNAAGGINPSFRVGDLMLITDHIGLANMVGLNPLTGPNDPAFGPRFPDMTCAYDAGLRALALRAAEEEGSILQQGVYVGLAGPSFETPAELRFLRSIGGDAVGMSTVPEVTVARHAGMRVLGVSGISNIAIQDTDTKREATHAEVLEAGRELGPRLSVLIRGVLRRLEEQSSQHAQ